MAQLKVRNDAPVDEIDTGCLVGCSAIGRPPNDQASPGLLPLRAARFGKARTSAPSFARDKSSQ